MKPYEYQIEFADRCWPILKERGYVYLAGKPRSGKTLTAILIAEKSDAIKNVLVLTKKAAISGWHKFIHSGLKHKYFVTNYEQVGVFKCGMYKLKLNPKDYDLVIIDESHNLGVVGKPTNRIKVIRKLCYDMPHIHLSGTAIVESPNSIFHQMCISKYSPFRYSNFYEFFRVYGVPYYIKIAGVDRVQYDRCKPELLAEINKFTVYMTQEDAGISEDVQAIDIVHYITLDDTTKTTYNTLQRDQIIELKGRELVCDSVIKLRTSLHMLESGVAKIGKDYLDLGNREKINYILETFGDSEHVGIMAHFIGERNILEGIFKKAKIYSSNAHSEGVDLSHLKSFIIFSSDYSGSKFIQRRERIINTEGSNTLEVHHLLVRKAISEQVYNRVSKKQDFNNQTYKRKEL